MRHLILFFFLTTTSLSCIDSPKKIEYKKLRQEPKIKPEEIWNYKNQNPFDTGSIQNLEAVKGFRKIKLGTPIDSFEFSNLWNKELLKFKPQLKIYSITKSYSNEFAFPMVDGNEAEVFLLTFLNDSLVEIVMDFEGSKDEYNKPLKLNYFKIESYLLYKPLFIQFGKHSKLNKEIIQETKPIRQIKDKAKMTLDDLFDELEGNRTKYKLSAVWESNLYLLRYNVEIEENITTKIPNTKSYIGKEPKQGKKFNSYTKHRIKIGYNQTEKLIKELQDQNESLLIKEKASNDRKENLNEF